MEIRLAKSAGFCFGVQRAINIAFDTAKSKSQIEMLGDIVHNEDVVNEISKTGIKKTNTLKKGKNKTLLIRAHGAPEKTFAKARSLKYEIVDATCPMVKEIHKIAQGAEKRGFQIIVIGDKKHDEVTGILGQIKKKALVIDSIDSIPIEKIARIKKIAVVVQSTQNLKKVLAIVDVLKISCKELEFFNTICRPTRKKQEEIRTMPLENDVMIIIGSKTSANTKRLYQISKELNKHSYWIQSKNEISPQWFKNKKSVGITAGASTPDTTIKAVIDHIKNIN